VTRADYTEEKAMAEGLAAAQAGLPKAALNETPYTYIGSELFRNAWLIGWRNGGGDILRGVVVTKQQRLIERRTQLLAELAETERLIEQAVRPGESSSQHLKVG
jgi:ribosome modulation factor